MKRTTVFSGHGLLASRILTPTSRRPEPNSQTQALILFGVAGVLPKDAASLGEEILRPALAAFGNEHPPVLRLSLRHRVVPDGNDLSGADLDLLMKRLSWPLSDESPPGSGFFFLRRLGTVPGTELVAMLLAGTFTLHPDLGSERRHPFNLAFAEEEAVIRFDGPSEDISTMSAGHTASGILNRLRWPVEPNGTQVAVRSTLDGETMRLLDERGFCRGVRSGSARDARLHQIETELRKRGMFEPRDPGYPAFEAAMVRSMCRRGLGLGCRILLPADANALDRTSRCILGGLAHAPIPHPEDCSATS